MPRRPTLEFLKTESGAGMVLVAAALTAVVMANSRWTVDYHALVDLPVPIRVGDFAQTRTVAGWVKDGLMTIFFLVVGMEVKYEVLRGELTSPRRLALPLIAAAGGIIAPALIYLAMNAGAGGAPQAWPATAPTDVAFALAALSVTAPRSSSSLRIFLLTLAIADDLAAVGMIAALFTKTLQVGALIGAGLILAAVAALSRWRQAPFALYAAGFILVWAFTLVSGVNTSVAGVACAMTIPVGMRRPGQDSVLKYFMDGLHPYVAYVILPLYAFTASGVSWAGMKAVHVTAAMPLGIALALIIGKPLGVFGASGLAVAMRLARRPAGSTWLELLGVALLCGVGFTMSLYIGALAFPAANAIAQAQVRLAVIAGSFTSVILGGALMAWTHGRRADRDSDRV